MRAEGAGLAQETARKASRSRPRASAPAGFRAAWERGDGAGRTDSAEERGRVHTRTASRGPCGALHESGCNTLRSSTRVCHPCDRWAPLESAVPLNSTRDTRRPSDRLVSSPHPCVRLPLMKLILGGILGPFLSFQQRESLPWVVGGGAACCLPMSGLRATRGEGAGLWGGLATSSEPAVQRAGGRTAEAGAAPACVPGLTFVPCLSPACPLRTPRVAR